MSPGSYSGIPAMRRPPGEGSPHEGIRYVCCEQRQYLRREGTATGTRIDPYRGFPFLLEVGGVIMARFRECSGLCAEVNVVDYREGSDQSRERLEIKTEVSITLNRGVTHLAELWKWRHSIVDGAAERRSGSIIRRNETGSDVLRWKFTKAWLSKWTGASFHTADKSVALDSVEITVEQILQAPA